MIFKLFSTFTKPKECVIYEKTDLSSDPKSITQLERYKLELDENLLFELENIQGHEIKAIVEEK